MNSLPRSLIQGLAGLLALAAGAPAQTPPRPNIVLIFKEAMGVVQPALFGAVATPDNAPAPR
jgi:hypothetical protein